MRVALLAVGLVFAALGLLTVFKAPDWLDWRFAVVACQFSYVFAVIPLVAGVAAWLLPGGRGIFGWAACAACATSVALLVQPCAQAWAMGRRLPESLAQKFGAATVPGRPFEFARLFSLWPARAPKSTWTYSGSLKLDFYPAIGRSRAPCIIVVHGGGWDDGGRGQVSQFNDWLARSGYAVADISYRLAPASVWPAQKDDVAAAIAFVKDHAAGLDIDAGKLVIMGRSAGGQIAEASAYALRDPSIRGVVGLYAPADMNFAWKWGRSDDPLNSPLLLRQFLGGTPETARKTYDSASAILLVDARSPPTLLVHGTIDTLVWNRQSERLADRLTGAGVANMLVSMPWATHALEYNLSGPSGQLTEYAVSWFLAAVFR
jgi:acetyl esterase/lipase